MHKLVQCICTLACWHDVHACPCQRWSGLVQPLGVEAADATAHRMAYVHGLLCIRSPATPVRDLADV